MIGRLDDLARRLGHQASHPGELSDLLDAAPGSRVGHQEDRVEVDLAPSDVVPELLHHLGGDRSRAWVQKSRTLL